MKKRWLAVYVENNVGVLAKISGLFAGKNYNVDSLTVGTTDDDTISRMTIGLTSSDIIFEQIKKQLNRCIEIIKVVDLTDVSVEVKELLFIKVFQCSAKEKAEIFQIAKVFHVNVCDYGRDEILLESCATCKQSDELIAIMEQYPHIEIVRSGAVAIERCKKTKVF